MLSLPGYLSQSTPSLTISETDSLYVAVTTLHHELKLYAPEPFAPPPPHRSSREDARTGSVAVPAGGVSTIDQCEYI